MNTYPICDRLHFRDPRRAAQLGSITETTPKAPFLYVNRSRIQYGFCAGVKAIQYIVTIGLILT